MNGIFLKLVDVSLTASIAILLLLLLRPLLKKCPSFIRCILWAVVLLRLMIPIQLGLNAFTMPSLPSASDIFVSESVAEPPAANRDESFFTPPLVNGESDILSQAPSVAPEDAVKPPVTDTPAPSEKEEEVKDDAATEKQSISALTVISTVWVCGVALMLLYILISSIVLRIKTRKAIVYDSRIRIINTKASPFIKGIIRPTIYIPANLKKSSWEHIIAHESAHIKRLDHLLKPFAFTVLAVYWMNPLVWAAYIMLCKDIEYACDEKVVKNMEISKRQEYSLSLLSCAAEKSLAAFHPLAFGKVSVKERIKRVMNYKISIWAICLALLVSTMLVVLLACSPDTNMEAPSDDASTSDTTEDNKEQTKYFGGIEETTDENGHKGYILKASQWGDIDEVITNDFLTELWADFLTIWEKSDFVAVDLAEGESFSLGNAEDVITGSRHNVTLSTSFEDYSFYLYDNYYKFRHTKVSGRRIVFEKPAVFGEPAEFDDGAVNTLPLLFLRLIYGIKPNYVANCNITSGVHSDAATITISDTKSIVYWGGISIQPHWWLPALNQTSVYYTDSMELYKDEEDKDKEVRVFDDGGPEIVQILSSKPIKNFKFISIIYDDDSTPYVGEVLYEADEISLYKPFYVKTMINEELSTKGISYTNEDGQTVYKRIIYDPKGGELDRSLCLEPFTNNTVSSEIARVSWFDCEAIYTESLNSEKVKNEEALPMYLLDTKEDVDKFRATFENSNGGSGFDFDESREGYKSLNQILNQYDEKYLKDHSLLLIYVRSGSGSYRYAVKSIDYKDGGIWVKIKQTNRPQWVTDDMAGWIFCVSLTDSDVKNCDYIMAPYIP